MKNSHKRRDSPYLELQNLRNLKEEMLMPKTKYCKEQKTKMLKILTCRIILIKNKAKIQIKKKIKFVKKQ